MDWIVYYLGLKTEREVCMYWTQNQSTQQLITIRHVPLNNNKKSAASPPLLPLLVAPRDIFLIKRHLGRLAANPARFIVAL